jgi:hypothetical protein
VGYLSSALFSKLSFAENKRIKENAAELRVKTHSNEMRVFRR